MKSGAFESKIRLDLETIFGGSRRQHKSRKLRRFNSVYWIWPNQIYFQFCVPFHNLLTNSSIDKKMKKPTRCAWEWNSGLQEKWGGGRRGRLVTLPFLPPAAPETQSHPSLTAQKVCKFLTCEAVFDNESCCGFGVLQGRVLVGGVRVSGHQTVHNLALIVNQGVD